VSLIVIEIPDGPTCDKCGAPITTGLMAAFCPMWDECEFWPEDEEGERFIMQFREPQPVIE